MSSLACPLTWRAPVKAYIATTGTVFGLVTLAHLWRVISESAALARDPGFILLTLLTAGLCVWAFRLLRPMSKTS
jgi:formate-dependent nitrite reductase membrane component NrfD